MLMFSNFCFFRLFNWCASAMRSHYCPLLAFEFKQEKLSQYLSIKAWLVFFAFFTDLFRYTSVAAIGCCSSYVDSITLVHLYWLLTKFHKSKESNNSCSYIFIRFYFPFAVAHCCAMNPKFETSPVSRGRRFSHVQLFADFGYYHEECSHRKYHPRNNQMDLARTEAVLLNGKRLSLDESLPEVVQALMNDGCALLKRATNLKPVEPFLATDMNSLESVRKEIVLNEVSSTWITL